jgi:hypothetical protein
MEVTKIIPQFHRRFAPVESEGAKRTLDPIRKGNIMSEQQNTTNEELNQSEIPEEELSEVSGGATMVERTAGGPQ